MWRGEDRREGDGREGKGEERGCEGNSHLHP